MPRPRKCRRVCKLPKTNEFVPVCGSEETIIITVDEFETIRLIDKEGLSREDCAEYMQIARTTAQQIYNDARQKIATALVLGRNIRIEGGDYVLCDGDDSKCCCKRKCKKSF